MSVVRTRKNINQRYFRAVQHPKLKSTEKAWNNSTKQKPQKVYKMAPMRLCCFVYLRMWGCLRKKEAYTVHEPMMMMIMIIFIICVIFHLLAMLYCLSYHAMPRYYVYSRLLFLPFAPHLSNPLNHDPFFVVLP